MASKQDTVSDPVVWGRRMRLMGHFHPRSGSLSALMSQDWKSLEDKDAQVRRPACPSARARPFPRHGGACVGSGHEGPEFNLGSITTWCGQPLRALVPSFVKREWSGTHLLGSRY